MATTTTHYRQRVMTTVPMCHLQPTCQGIAYKQVPVVDYTEAEYRCRCTVAASACPLWGIKPRKRSERDGCMHKQQDTVGIAVSRSYFETLREAFG